MRGQLPSWAPEAYMEDVLTKADMLNWKQEQTLQHLIVYVRTTPQGGTRTLQYCAIETLHRILFFYDELISFLLSLIRHGVLRFKQIANNAILMGETCVKNY